ncbi:hypothetical protein [Streptococcus sobrinus]|uniref:hypothetical protein n=1 Tax=Streptococcus sobrinus TaxID=1310 RepID=UPI0002EEF0EE|nr:hypothetical protein [Streptococcus sobrinus]AWN18773.1 hypothetical protein DK181_04695 [Streptococcus sobrinus]
MDPILQGFDLPFDCWIGYQKDLRPLLDDCPFSMDYLIQLKGYQPKMGHLRKRSDHNHDSPNH